jgi:hypothetical protein
MHNTTYHVRNFYEGTEYELSMTHGSERVSVGLRPELWEETYGFNMPTDQARQIAADIVRRCDEIDGGKAPDLAGQAVPEGGVTVTLTRAEADGLVAAAQTTLDLVEPQYADAPARVLARKAAGLAAIDKLHQAARGA